MGRQINYYMTENVQNLFIEYVKESGFTLLDRCGEDISCNCLDNVWTFYLYNSHYGELIRMEDRRELDLFESSVIELHKSSIKGHEIREGRIWMATQYYKEDVIIRKNEMLTKDFSRLVRWIKKNVPFQNIPLGEYYVKSYANDELIELTSQGFVFTL